MKDLFLLPEDAIRGITGAGGISVLAHPATYKDPEALLEELTAQGLCGVEVWHPTADKTKTDGFYAYAKKNKLLMIGGSDFRGMYTPTPISLVLPAYSGASL